MLQSIKDTGTLFVNLGDSYSNSNSISTVGRRGFYKDVKDMTLKKQMHGQKEIFSRNTSYVYARDDKTRLDLKKQNYLAKTNAMPESVRDRFTNDYEEVFFLRRKKIFL